MTYDEAMTELYDAVYAAIFAADNEDGAPVEALRRMARDVDSLISYRCTAAEFQDRQALYKGAKLAGLVP